MAPLEPQEKGFALADWHLKSCAACGIRCLPGVVSKRLGLLLSSLSLCLRFGSLTQFPPTLDLYRFAIACRGGFAGARRSTHYQDDMHCQMIRLHQNKMSRAAADDRSSGKSYSNIQRGNAAHRHSHSGGAKVIRARDCQSKTFLLGDLKGAILFCEREWPPFVPRRARRSPLPHSAGVSSILLINRQPKRQFDTKLLSLLSFLLILGPRLIIVRRHAEQR